jgi:hypothetical protein
MAIFNSYVSLPEGNPPVSSNVAGKGQSTIEFDDFHCLREASWLDIKRYPDVVGSS